MQTFLFLQVYLCKLKILSYWTQEFQRYIKEASAIW